MFNASEEIYQTVKMTPLNPSPCCKASFALNFYLPEFWWNWLFVNNAVMKLDSAGSGEWALDLLYLLSVLGIWHISYLSSWWSGHWVVWPVSPVLDCCGHWTCPLKLIKGTHHQGLIFIVIVKQSLQLYNPSKNKTIKLMIKVYPVSCIEWELPWVNEFN